MEHPPDLSRLELRGGDPALDFANTIEGPRGGGRARVDWLPDYEALLAWSQHAGLLDASMAEALRPRGRAAAHRDAVRLRATLARVFGALAAGDPAPAASLAALLRAHHEAMAHAVLEPETGRYVVTWSSANPGRPWWPVALAAVDLLRSDRLARLKGCAGCSWLFLDETKNRSRRWCSMADCGTAEKLRRRAAARPARLRRAASPAARSAGTAPARRSR